MITTEYLKSKGFKEEKGKYILKYVSGSVKVYKNMAEKEPKFQLMLRGQFMGELPEDKEFLRKIVKYFGNSLEYKNI